MEKERERLRKKIKDTSASASLKTNKPKKTYKPSDFKLGESVKSIKYESDRHQSALSPMQEATSQFRWESFGHKSIFPIWKLSKKYRLTAPKRMNRTAKSKIKMSKSLSVSPEINLLGKNSRRSGRRTG